jgi:hypothetical protein
MAKILIPRSDSVDVKIIEPSDFESFFSDDWINDYVKSGFTLSAGSGLSVNIAVGLGRLKGLFINNSTSATRSLIANTTNYIYVTLARDSNSQAESWSFTRGTTGSTPADSLFIGTAVTNGSSVTSVDDNNIETQAITGVSEWGDGSDGNVTLSSNTSLSGAKYYNNLTINSGVTITGASPIIIFARGTVTINGTITPDRTAGGAGGSGGAGGNATTATPDSSVVANVGKIGGSGVVGGIGFIHDNYLGASGGNGGASGTHASSGNQPVNNGGAGGIRVPLQSATPSQLMSKIRTSVLTNPNSKGGGGSGGAGGGGGGSGSAYCNPSGFNGGNGGAGGAGGGSVIIMAPTIIFNSGASINSNGLAGTNGSVGGNGNSCSGFDSGAGGQRYASGGGGGGGGGHGGHGGSIMFLYKSLTDSGTTSVTGGAHGNGGAGGTGGGSTYSYGEGSDGGAGGSGSSGGTGTLIKLDVS